ncbi:hypothetical protein AYO38_04750 [bacterium SCGC AG-212-C10]|nr:hypothetical protein AYO38_04750 [bacterium SCGC AG-212-C10]
MAIVLAMMPVAAPLFAAERPLANGTIVGDVNCDALVTAADPMATLRLMAGLDAGCTTGLADVNCNASVDPGDVLLLLRHVAGLSESTPAGCPAIGSTFVVSGPNSVDRIGKARLDGVITDGQALLYHLYAELDAAKLPLQFRGTPPSESSLESTVFEQVAAGWATFSASEQAALRPYLLPPAADESWAATSNTNSLAAVQWETVGNSRIKVWWQSTRPQDAAKAAAILGELDTVIWPELVAYMGAGHAPFSDEGLPNSGGDGRYDVYLVHNAPFEAGAKPVLGWVSPMHESNGTLKCELTPSYMVLNSRHALTPEFLSTVAHEFMHSVQFTYAVGDCEDYRWMRESTATWVESWLYPEVNAEHPFANKYLEEIDKKPLEYWKHADSKQYGSYLLWYHAEHNDGLKFAVRDAWNAATNKSSLKAVDQAFAGAGGLKKVWPESALFNWNREPYEDFSVQDQLAALTPWIDTEVKALNAPTSYPVPTDVAHLQQRHLNFSIDPSVKRLTFINSLYSHFDPDAKVQAMLKVNGQWLPEAQDWTNKERVSFCFDRPNEKVDQLVIIITNSNFVDRSHVIDAGPSELVATPSGCAGWIGSATAVIPHYNTTFTITVDNLRFAPDEENPGNDRYDFYDLVEAGDATWHVSGMWFDGCTPSGTMTLKPPMTDPTAIGGFFHVDKINNTYNVNVHGNTYEDTLIISCPGYEPYTHAWPISQILWDGANFKPIPEDNVISDQFVDPKPAYGGTWTWSFRLAE